MDFRVVGLEGFVGKETGAASQVQEQETKPKGLGSGFVKQERSGSDENDHRSSKMARTNEFLAPKTMPLHQGTPLLRSNSLLSDDGRSKQQMLSFSSLKSEVSLASRDGGLVGRTTQGTASSYYHHTPALYNSRNAGFGSGSLKPNMHGPFPGVRGPFTPSQWIELEHQALIYKYINANVPVPSNLLIPIKKSFNPFGLSGSSGGSIPPNSLAWSSFHLGFAGNNDPEPGRCRRTDGKKWRCSRDAVLDQKYCERHINRGRHRSRKPVEGQNGHAVSGTTNSKVAPLASSMPAASVISSGSASNSLGIAQHQFKSLQTGAAIPSTGSLVNRTQDQQGISILSPTINVKSRDGPFSILKQHTPFEEPSQSEFGFVSSDSLLNPSQKSSYPNPKNYASFLDFSDQDSQNQHPLRQFIEDWPKEQSDRSAISWPEELKSDWTQLSMSIPMTSSGFSSSSSSPVHEKLALSPLRLSREFDPIQMALGANGDFSETSQKQTNWIPISWGTSMGGPLGEVLNNTTSTPGLYKNSSALNIMTVGWDGSSQLESSPTGVLQKATFASLSNSSTSGSSPRTENKRTHERASLWNDVLGSAIASSSSIPSM